MASSVCIADAESFEVFNEYFGRDKNAVYFRAVQIQHPSLDVSSFDTTSDAYTNTYWLGQKSCVLFRIIWQQQ